MIQSFPETSAFDPVVVIVLIISSNIYWLFSTSSTYIYKLHIKLEIFAKVEGRRPLCKTDFLLVRWALSSQHYPIPDKKHLVVRCGRSSSSGLVLPPLQLHDRPSPCNTSLTSLHLITQNRHHGSLQRKVWENLSWQVWGDAEGNYGVLASEQKLTIFL